MGCVESEQKKEYRSHRTTKQYRDDTLVPCWVLGSIPVGSGIGSDP